MSGEHVVMVGIAIQFVGTGMWCEAMEMERPWRWKRALLYAAGMTVMVVGGVIWLPFLLRALH